mgnify:FL=1
MIVQETFELNGKSYVNTSSDKLFFIEREDGLRFVSAADEVGTTHTYTETDERLFSDVDLQNMPLELREKVLAIYK